MPGSNPGAPKSSDGSEAPKSSGDGCDRCGADLNLARCQPGANGDLLTEHHRCSDCGVGGFRVLDETGEEIRTGGRAFDDDDRRAEVQQAVDGGLLITDGAGCFWCAGSTTDYHPTCDRPGCDSVTHGSGPEGTRTTAYCPVCREA
jgi:hypothetical protein